MKKFLILTGMAVSLALPAGSIVLTEIRIQSEGHAPLDESFVQAYTSLRAGQRIESEAELNAAVARDVDNLRRSERFSFVRALVEQEAGDFRLVYQVAARQRLRSIKVTGAERIGNRKIRNQIEIKPGDYVDEALVGEMARTVEAYCRKNKYPEASVTWTLTPDEETGTVDLLLEVDEGPRVRVKRIRLEGDRFLSDHRAARTGRFFKRLVPKIFTDEKKPEDHFEQRDVRRAVGQKTTWWMTPWGGTFREELIPQDMASLRDFYRDRGFLDVTVSPPETRDLGKGRIELSYSVQEGRLYRIGDIGFDGVTLFSEEDLFRQADLQSGEIASQRQIHEAADAINRYYGNRGYIRNAVNPIITADAETGTADVLFMVREGEQAFINEIEILGNEKTRDVVLRRELAVHPGEMFHQQKVETSENRLRNLGFFETVNSSYFPADKEENAYDLTFNVKEKAMGNFLVGAGFSSVDSLVGFAELSHGNFDIRRWPPIGDGQKMRIRVQAGTERNDAEISFIEPWFLNQRLALGVDLYHRNAGYYSDVYDMQTLGGRLSLTKPLGAFVRGTLSYSLEQFRIYDIKAPAGARILNEEGSRSKSTIGIHISRDTRDQFFIPTRGNISSAGIQFAGGPLGGETDIYLLEARSSYFHPLPGGHVFNLKGAVSTVDTHGSGRVPIFDRLFLGGPRDLRAFDFRDVSPRDPNNNNEPDGGLSSWYVTAEYTVPLWERIRGAVFYDIGEVSSDSFSFTGSDINSGYGIGIRLDLPMFPLRLDYAFPHLTDSMNQDAGGRWSFLLGYTF